MKKLIALTLIAVMLLTCTVFAAETTEAAYTDSTVEVNGKVVAFEAYNIKDNNYFKLRDVAMAVNGSEKQFEVTWNEEAQAVEMLSNKPYTVVGGELAQGDGKNKPAEASESKFYKDGGEIMVTAYLINGNNYIKLRDLGKLFDFGIEWDGENNRIVVDTALSYTDVETEKKETPFYNDYPDVVDFGKLLNIALVKTSELDGGKDGKITAYCYNLSEVAEDGEKLYKEKLEENDYTPLKLSNNQNLFFTPEGRAVLLVKVGDLYEVHIYQTRLSKEEVYEYLVLAAMQMLGQ